MEGIAGTVPELRNGIVTRARLIERIRAEHDCPVVALVAAAGFGKTTLLVEAAHADPRPAAWVSLSAGHDDPAVLMTDIAVALGQIEPISPRELSALTSTTVDFNSIQLPRLRRLLAERAEPFVLVLDDVHRLAGEGAIATVEALCDAVPRGAQVMLATRDGGSMHFGALRARGACVLDSSDLTMDLSEATDLLRSTGLALSAASCELLVERTEGWPVGLYLAAVALRGQPEPDEAARRFAGDDRVVVDYLRDELFERLPDGMVEFLVGTSVLDALSGALCDAVLASDGSARVLEELEQSNLLVMPLDRTRERFRYHALLRDELRSRLHRYDPALERLLHRRASAWYASEGMFSEAVVHAAAAADHDRFDELVWLAAPRFVSSGRTATVEGWLSLVSPNDVARRPALTITAAWCALTSRDMARLGYWFAVAERLTDDRELADGTPFAACVALLRSLIGASGLEAIRDDAAVAYALHPPTSPYRPIACLLEGAALRLLGDRAAAKDRLIEGAVAGELLNPATQAQCLAQLALLSVEDGAWSDAESFADQALELVDRFNLHDRGAQAEVFAVGALVHAHAGAHDDARTELKQSLWLLSMYTTIAPWLAVEARVLLARSALLLGDLDLSRMLIKEAGELVPAVPETTSLVEELERLRTMVDVASSPLGVTATPLTPAEMRVLRYLPTHLTFAAIADELFVSRNTVKTQAISIYRKLGVSSRTPAVETARGLGLLEV